MDYTKRHEEMLYMRHMLGMTLEEIGKGYGISRERVRQIIGNTGKDFRASWTKDLIKSGKIQFSHWTELPEAPGVKREWIRDWGNHRHEPVGGEVLKGYNFERVAHIILWAKGVGCKLMPFRCGYDIECENGARVEVTVSNVDISQMNSQNKSVYPTYAVVHRHSEIDFLFAFVPDGKGDYTYFVIPISALSHLKTKDARIRIPYPPISNKPSKWHQYHERIDLIRSFEK